jgi:DNA recombination protein RmuC
MVRNKEEMALKFRDLSNEILKSQNQQFYNEQKNTFQLLLKPFQDQMSDFKKKVETAHEDTLKNKSSFDEQLHQLLALNQNLSQDAKDLSAALKGNKKIQGNWGEFQLERVLEISGLQKGLNYVTQETFKNEENQMLRPDVIVQLPNERSVIIDSKVSLNDYMNYVNCDNDAQREEFLKKHIQCIKNHIDELSSKEYQKLLKNSSLDYVVIFIPIESAYVEAVRFDNGLYDYAYKKNIAVTTPSSLLPILRTIENLWKIENQNKNVAEIASIGGSLYDKIAGFAEDMQRIDKSLEAARKNYDQAIGKLTTGKGNALSLAARLKEKGAKASKLLGIDYDETETLNLTKGEEND